MKTYIFEVEGFDDYSIGLKGFNETVKVTIESGRPGGDETGPYSFQECIRQFLIDWYDETMVTLKNPCTCRNPRYGFPCTCNHTKEHPGNTEYICEFCGRYTAGSAICNRCKKNHEEPVDKSSICKTLDQFKVLLPDYDAFISGPVGESLREIFDKHNALVKYLSTDI